MKVLLVRPGAMGDVCLAVPFARSLARSCRVHWLVRPAYRPLVDRFAGPGVTAVVTDLGRFDPSRPLHRPYPPELVDRLRGQRFDAVLDLCRWPEVARLAADLTDVPIRAVVEDVAQDERLGVAPSGLAAHTHRVPIDTHQHQVAKWRQLARAALGVEVADDWPLPPPKDASPIRVFVHPHASKPSKRWPVGSFVEVLTRVARHRPLVCLLNAGNRAEWLTAVSLWARLRMAGVPVQVVWRDRGFGGLIAAMQTCHVALGCDSGPMHLAGLVGLPTVVVYGPYPAWEFAPPWRSIAVEPPRAGMHAATVAPASVVVGMQGAFAYLRDEGRHAA